MANRSLINHHQLDLMKAALPYMAPGLQKSIEVLSKTEELMNTFSSPVSGELSAMSLSSGKVEMEEVLSQIRPVCNKREQDLVDNMLNVMRMQKLFQGYSSFMSTKQAASNTVSAASTDNQSKNEKQANSQSGNGIFGGSQDTLMEFLLSQLSPDQKGNFENISKVLNAMNN